MVRLPLSVNVTLPVQKRAWYWGTRNTAVVLVHNCAVSLLHMRDESGATTGVVLSV